MKSLFRPISPASLAAFRIVFAALMLVEVLRMWFRHEAEFPPWEFWALYEPLEFLRSWPRLSPQTTFPLLTVAALGLLLGLLTRFCAAMFSVVYAYQFLLDPTHWNNHYYLIFLLSFWLIFVRSEAMWSLDARLRPRLKRDFVPWWHLGIFRCQLAIVYFYGGLAKFRSDWLQAEPVHPWLMVEQDTIPLLGPLLADKGTAYFVAYFGLIFDLTIPIFLIWKRSRPYAITVAVLFHLMNTQLFEIGIFPFLGIASLLVFVDPDTPSRFMERAKKGCRDFFGLQETTEPPSEEITPSPVQIGNWQRAIAVWLGIYLIFQLLIPFRHLLYAGDVEWTEEAKHFSWRMMLSHKKTFVRIFVMDSASGVGVEVDQGGLLAKRYQIPRGTRSFFVHQHDSGRQQPMMVPEKLLSRRHGAGKGVWGNPRLLAQYARYLAEEARALGMKEPHVFADAVASLNGRPFQYLVDPEWDLVKTKGPMFASAPWIVHLNPDQPIGDYAESAEELNRRVQAVITGHRKQVQKP